MATWKMNSFAILIHCCHISFIISACLLWTKDLLCVPIMRTQLTCSPIVCKIHECRFTVNEKFLLWDFFYLSHWLPLKMSTFNLIWKSLEQLSVESHLVVIFYDNFFWNIVRTLICMWFIHLWGLSVSCWKLNNSATIHL